MFLREGGEGYGKSGRLPEWGRGCGSEAFFRFFSLQPVVEKGSDHTVETGIRITSSSLAVVMVLSPVVTTSPRWLKRFHPIV
jgi:hypothetical protein